MKTMYSLLFLLLFLGLRASADPTANDKARAAQLNHQGVGAFAAGHFADAVPSFQEAAKLDPTVEAYVLNLAKSLQGEGRYADGQTLLESRTPGFPLPDDQKELRIELADIHFYWGNALLAKRDDEAALTQFQAALVIDRDLRPSDVAYDLDKIAFAYNEMSRFELAIGYYEQALPLLRELKNRDGEAQTLNAYGLACFHLSRYEQAMGFYEQARVIWHALNDLPSEATALSNLGAACDNSSRYKEAIDYFHQAILIQRKLKDIGAEARTLNNVGSVHDHLSQAKDAIALYTQALPLWRQAHDRLGEATSLANIGLSYDHLGQYPRAIVFYNRALPILQEFKDKTGEARTLSNLATARLSLKQYDQAIILLEQALEIEMEIGARDAQAATLNNLGNVYNELGQYNRAMEIFNQALLLWQATKDRAGEASAYGNLGLASDNLNQFEQAAQFYQNALPIQREIGDRIGEATTLNNLGAIFNAFGQYDQAIVFLNQTLVLTKETHDKAHEGTALNNLGECYDNLHQLDRALDSYRQALLIRREVKDRVGEAITLHNLMSLWKDQGRPALAILYGKAAVNDYQSVRGDVQSLDKDTQKTYIASLAQSYRSLAELLIGEGRFDEARQVLGMLKEEEFFDFLGRDPSAAKALVAQVDLTPLESVWNAKYRQVSDGPALAALFHDMAAVFSSPTPRELPKSIPAFPAGTAAVYTIVEPDKLFLIVTSPTGQTAREYPIKADDLYRKVLAFRNALQDPAHDPRPLAQELYKIIVGPIEGDLQVARITTILWSLDDALRYLPIAALHDGKSYFVERCDNGVLTLAGPSRTASPSVAAPWTGLGLGVSHEHPGFDALPGVRAELAGIIGPVVPGQTLLDAQFTQASFLAALKRRSHPLVHIASHFSLSGRDTDSFLLLGDGGHLSIAQIKADPNVFAGVDLLTLSACNTAMEVRSAGGKEVEGFGALAQRLGARSVLASLWPVADASTPVLMREFYRLRRLHPRQSKASDLRQAQTELLYGKAAASSPPSKTNRAQRAKVAGVTDTQLPPFATDPKAPYAHPYYWAPFVLIENTQ